MPQKKLKLVIKKRDSCDINPVKTEPPCKYKNDFNSVINELDQNPKDICRKVCTGCHNIGHGKTSINCKLNIDKNNLLKGKIKEYMLTQDCVSGKTNDEHFAELSKKLEISPNKCKTLYEEIPPIEWFNRVSNIKLYIESLRASSLNCHDCNKVINNINTNTHRPWKGNTICDSCWSEYKNERDLLWEKICETKIEQCNICSKTKMKEGERYHYDHINMFDKANSICSMVNEGNTIDEINIELDKCQILCLSCHHMISDIERKLGYTRIKQMLTRKLNNLQITEEEYTQQKIEIGEKYVKKMSEIYDELKLYSIINNYISAF